MTVRRPASAIALLLLAAAGCTLAAGGRPPIDDALWRFRAAVADLGGRVGVCVADPDRGAVLLSVAADEGFVPASNVKLLTAAVALETLGPDARIRTELHRSGEVRDGVLHGDLILRGFGDPTFGTPVGADPRLRELALAVRTLGVHRVEGRVRGDGSWLGDERLGQGWEWGDLGEAFAAPFGGLCCGGNVQAVVGRDGVRRQVPVADPAAFAATTFAGVLRDEGIEVADADTIAIGDEQLVATVQSPPLSQLLRTMLADSDNLFAEQLWRVAARVVTGAGDSVPAHTRQLLLTMAVGTHGMVLVDGSGLSRLDLVRPAQLVDLLRAMRASRWAQTFVDALPRGGESGTLRERFTAGPARGRVLAKTGTLTRVACLSGYLLRPAGEPLVFSVLWNDFCCGDAVARRAVDAFVQDLAVAVGW